MNEDLQKIVMYYATKSHKELNDLLLSKSKDNLISCLNDLLTAYMNDKNSSSLREFITVSIAGYTHNAQKLEYNGYKHISAIGGNAIMCEAKPKNINTEDFEKQKSKTKLNGQGNFTDYTPERFKKDLKENLNMLSSGFVNGELQYIIEYPFKSLKNRLEEQLPEHREKGQYTRSANFCFEHYKNDEALKIIYLNQKAISSNEPYFNKSFFKFLIEYE